MSPPFSITMAFPPIFSLPFERQYSSESFIPLISFIMMNYDIQLQLDSMKMESSLLDDDFWTLNDDMISECDLYPAVPLSVVENNSNYHLLPSSASTSPDHIQESIFGDFDEDKNDKVVSPSRAELATELLIKLEEPKPEPFTDWLEEKIDLQVFDEYAQLARDQSQHTQSLLLEFENVCGVVGVHPCQISQIQPQIPIHHFDQLTPPQSPPPHDILQLDVAKELAVVDEIVNNTAEDFAWSEKNIQFPEQYSVNRFDLEPDSPKSSSSLSSSDSSYGSCDLDDDWSSDSAKKSKYRSKPYSRNVDDKRSRKKEQNKNAATRYRQKKKAEVEILAEEEKQLEDKNSDLKKQVKDLDWETNYLRGLMRELLKARKVVKQEN